MKVVIAKSKNSLAKLLLDVSIDAIVLVIDDSTIAFYGNDLKKVISIMPARPGSRCLAFSGYNDSEVFEGKTILAFTILRTLDELKRDSSANNIFITETEL